MRLVLAFEAALLAALGLALTGASCRPRAMRVVLVTLDTLRYDSLAGDGAPSLMPLTLARARKGRLFEHAFAATTSTQPTHATIFTGLHPWAHGVTANGRVLEERHRTVAELLSEEGFETAAVVASMPVAARFGFGQGFRTFREPFTEGFGGDTWEGTTLDGGRFYAHGGTITDEAIRLLDASVAPKQFLWVHYFDAHSPYGDAPPGVTPVTPAELLRRIRVGGVAAAGIADTVRGLYGDDVRALDREVDRLLARLDRDAARIDTHVVVTSDHGESLGEDLVIGHGNHLAPEQVRVPLFVLSPRMAAGLDARNTGSIDLAPTLLSLAGVKAALPGGCDLTVRDATRPCHVVGMRRTYAEPLEALRTDGTSETLSGLLFYLADDKGRLHLGNGTNLRAEDAGATWTQALTGLFRSFEGQLAGHPASAATDPETLRALRALGYLP